VRLYLDGQPIIDEWREQAAIVCSVELNLSAGQHTLRMEFFEAAGVARAQLTWKRIDPPSALDAWHGEYFTNRSLGGSPAMVRYDALIDFNWLADSPAPQIPGDNFSVRWMRTIYLSGGRYRITTTTDDGVRLYVDGQRVLQRWYDQVATHNVDLDLGPGNHSIILEYFEHLGHARARLAIERIE